MLRESIELAKSQIPKMISVGFVSLIGYFGAQIWHSISTPLAQYILPAIPGSILMSLTLLLCLLLLASFSYIFYLHYLLKNHREIGNFQNELWLARDTGVGVHKKTRETYCYPCAIKNVKAPLRRGEKDNWICVSCNEPFHDPFGAEGQYAGWLKKKEQHN